MIWYFEMFFLSLSIIIRDMKVKFTESVLNRVVFGTIVEMFNAETFVVQGDNGGRYIINPNSDYNFGFIPNKEATRKYADRLDAIVDESGL
jgi:hypothetical protein